MRLHCRLFLLRQARRRATWSTWMPSYNRGEGIQDRRLQSQDKASPCIVPRNEDYCRAVKGYEKGNSKPAKAGIGGSIEEN